MSREEVYLLSITMDSVEEWEWDGENENIFVVSKWGSGSRKCLLLNGLDDFVLNKICSCFASLSEGEISIQCGAELQSMMKM